MSSEHFAAKTARSVLCIDSKVCTLSMDNIPVQGGEVLKWTGGGRRGGGREDYLEGNMAESFPELMVLISAVWIQVGPHSPAEQHRVLWDGCNAASHILKTQAVEVTAVKSDDSTIRFHDAEEGDNEGGLAAACPAYNSHLLASCHLK